MAAVKERIKCWRCGNECFEKDEDEKDDLICTMCRRQYTKDGYQIRHPIGVGDFTRSDGKLDKRYGPRQRSE